MAFDDPQDEAEALDEDELAGASEYPPERLLGADDYGTTPAEERVPEPLDEFAKREQPDRLRPNRAEPPLLIDPESAEGLEDDEIEPDFATELEAPLPAEEAAIHIIKP
jgi:hypothetical protein